MGRKSFAAVGLEAMVYGMYFIQQNVKHHLQGVKNAHMILQSTLSSRHQGIDCEYRLYATDSL